jgi:hypothetical protein
MQYVSFATVRDALGISSKNSSNLRVKIANLGVARAGFTIDDNGEITKNEVYTWVDASTIIAVHHDDPDSVTLEPETRYKLDDRAIILSAALEPVELKGAYPDDIQAILSRVVRRDENEFDVFLDQCEDLGRIGDTELGKKPGWLASAMKMELGWTKSETTQYGMIDRALIRTLGRDSLKNAGFRDRKKFYYASRMVLTQGEDPGVALQMVRDMKRHEAAAAANDDEPIVDLPFKVKESVADMFERGVNRMRQITGLSEGEAIEHLANWLENGPENTIQAVTNFFVDMTPRTQETAATA